MNTSSGKTILHRQNINSIDTSDPATTLTVVDDQASVTVDYFFDPGVGCNEIGVSVDFGAEDSGTDKYIILRPIYLFKNAAGINQLRWGDDFTLGNGNASFRGIAPMYKTPVYFKVIELSALTTIPRIDLFSIFA